MGCEVQGHDHQLVLVRRLEQSGSGMRAALMECPTGRYRYLVLDGQQPSKYNRLVRPRFGWRS